MQSLWTIHDLKKCFYLFPNRVPDGLRERPAIRRLINLFLEADQIFANQLENERKEEWLVREVGGIPASFALLLSKYPLRNLPMLDSGTTIHIFNKLSRFEVFRTAPPGDFAWAEDSKGSNSGIWQCQYHSQFITKRR
jgi:hypothetical protein